MVRKVNEAGIISTIAGNDTAGFSGDGGPATAAELNWPFCISIDPKGNVYFVDNSNNRVRRVDGSGIITTFAGNGSSISSGDGGPATSAGLEGCVGICIDVTGNIYISEALRIRKVDTFGIITTFAGNGLAGVSGDGGPATAASVPSDGQISMDALGNMFIADGDNSIIRKINTSGIITTVAGNGRAGFGGDGGPATAAQLDGSLGVFPDNCDNFYISDWNNDRIRKVDGHGIITTVAGNGIGSPSSGGYGGDGGPATAAEFNHPIAIFLDEKSNIYIPDQSNYCVRYIQMDSCKNVLDVTRPSLPIMHVMLFPNPVVTSLTITSSEKIASIAITNLIGETIYSSSFHNVEVQVDVSKLPAGIYLVRINGTDVRKFVKE